MLKFAQSFLQRSRSQKSEKSQGLTYQFLMETSNVGQNWILKQYSAAEESIHWENNLFSVSRGTMKFSLLAPPGNNRRKKTIIQRKKFHMSEPTHILDVLVLY